MAPNNRPARRAAAAALLAPHSASAASSKGCDKDGGFSITLGDGSTSARASSGTIAASRLNTARLLVRGKFITFDVDPKTFAVYDYAFTGAPTRSTSPAAAGSSPTPARSRTTAG